MFLFIIELLSLQMFAHIFAIYVLFLFHMLLFMLLFMLHNILHNILLFHYITHLMKHSLIYSSTSFILILTIYFLLHSNFGFFIILKSNVLHIFIINTLFIIKQCKLLSYEFNVHIITKYL